MRRKPHESNGYYPEPKATKTVFFRSDVIFGQYVDTLLFIQWPLAGRGRGGSAPGSTSRSGIFDGVTTCYIFTLLHIV